jgi:hypothetical protein
MPLSVSFTAAIAADEEAERAAREAEQTDAAIQGLAFSLDAFSAVAGCATSPGWHTSMPSGGAIHSTSNCNGRKRAGQSWDLS